MRIRVNPAFNIETGELLTHSGEYEHSGPVILFKGGTSQATANMNTANAEQSTLQNMGLNEENQVLPFLSSEMTNPSGFGQQGVNELMTAGGEATSGALGGAKEAAQLKASRTGNPSTSSSIIDAAARAGMNQQSNNALGVNEANLKEKLAQQQAGEQGIASLGEANIGESLSALGLSNQAVQDYISAYSQNSPMNTIPAMIGNVGKGVGAAAAGILGG
jgi:hypothetical protein